MNNAESAERPRRGWLLAGVAVVAVALDLLTKTIAVSTLENQPAVEVIGGVLYFVHVRNPGAAFSLGTGFTWVFTAIALIVVLVIARTARRLRSSAWAIALGLVLGGAAGNLCDRLFRSPGPLYGHVVDFISVFDDAGQVFPVFNLADSALFCGVVLAVYLELTGRRPNGTRVTRKGHDSTDDSTDEPAEESAGGTEGTTVRGPAADGGTMGR